MFQLGNTLGYYLNDIACADLSGAHFLAVHKTFALTQPELLVTHIPGTALPFPPGTVATPATTKAMAQDVRYTFFNHLPDLIPHSRPLEPAQVPLKLYLLDVRVRVWFLCAQLIGKSDNFIVSICFNCLLIV